jgi:protein-L-isoaspartate(D-aspartate) O-methyltransferase
MCTVPRRVLPVLVVILTYGMLLSCGGQKVTSLPTQDQRQATTDTVPPHPTQDPYEKVRHAMVKFQMEERGITDQEVLRVMETVPRHEFVLPEYLDEAYADHPLPIGYGQTISQPYIVAVMTELLHLRRDTRVLEIGTGSGYQAAILAGLVQEVYSIEIIEALCTPARERLTRLGYSNVQVKCGDGYYGWEKHAPFDAIIVTAAPDHIPQPLVNQLADGGRMVIPVGPPGAYQVLWLVERRGEEVKSQRMMGVAFVPLTGGH